MLLIIDNGILPHCGQDSKSAWVRNVDKGEAIMIEVMKQKQKEHKQNENAKHKNYKHRNKLNYSFDWRG